MAVRPRRQRREPRDSVAAVLEPIRDEIFSLANSIHSPYARIAASNTNPDEGSPAASSLNLRIVFGYCTIMISFSQSDRQILGHFFSDFQMATHPVTYSKVVELYTIYNSTIGTELI